MKTSKEIRNQITEQVKLAAKYRMLEREAKGEDMLIYQQMAMTADNVAKALENMLEEVVNAEINLNAFDTNKLFTK